MPTDDDLATELDLPEGQALPPEPPIDEKADISSWVDKWVPQGLPQWVDIMLRPRRTIRAIVNENPGKYWKRLAGLSGALTADINLGFSGLGQLMAQVLLGVPLAMIGIYITANVMYFLGWIVKGKATQREVLAAVAWSTIPGSVAALLWIGVEAASLILMGESYAVSSPNAVLDVVASIVQVVGQVLFLWSTIIFLLTFAEVNRFSVWRAVGACLLPLLAFGICFGIFYFMANLQ